MFHTFIYKLLLELEDNIMANEITDKMDKCQWSKCGLPSEVVYLGSGLCEKHWIKICDMPMEAAHKKLGITYPPSKKSDEK